MKPIELELENFTSFRQRALIDFRPLSLFSITGPTGAGKTSLLDALGFALYGETPRLGPRGISELISLNASRLTVRLEFEAGDSRYQIVRVLKRAPKGGSNMTARLETWHDGGWQLHADQNVKTAIPKIVGLDFDGFTRSVVLPQGEFDRFLRGDAQARRKILSDLLHLDVYTEMAKRANQLAKDAAGESTHLEQLLARNYADATGEQRAAALARLDTLREQSETLAAESRTVRDLQSAALELREHRARASETRAALEIAGHQREDVESSAAQAAAEITSRQTALAALDRQLEASGYDDRAHLELLEVVPIARQADALRRSLASTRDDRGRRLAGLGALETAAKQTSAAAAAAAARTRETARTLAGAQQQFAGLRDRHGSREAVELALRGLGEARQHASRHASVASTLAQLRAAQQSGAADLERLTASEAAARKALDEASDALEHLRTLEAAGELRAHLEAGKPCPVCEQTVAKPPKAPRRAGLEKARTLVRDRQAAVDRAVAECAARRREIDLVPEQIRGQEQHLAMVREAIEAARGRAADVLGGEEPGEDAMERLEEIAGSLARLESAVESGRAALDREQSAEARVREKAEAARRGYEVESESVRGLDERVAEAESSLAGLEPRLAGRAALAALEAELRAQEQARKLRDEIERRRKSEDAALRAAEQRMAAKHAEAANLAARCLELSESLHALEAAREQRQRKLERKLEGLTLPDGRDEADRLERRRTALERELQRVGAESAVARERLETLERQIAEAAAYRGQIAGLARRFELCSELGRSLRQDHFIEFVQAQTLERLASDGTRHLEMLSQGQYSFSTRDNEFWVTDHANAGERRSVQTLSGGESFLASLALALAMAGSLAEFSSGTFTLESLFLDEGFSTLDPETLDVVVSAIEALSGGTRLVGVISHVPELAARLPHRLEVAKTARGSVVSVT